MKATADRYAVVIAYFLIYVVWGSTYYFIGVALEGLPTFLLGALRFSVAGAVLLLLCHIRGEKVFRPALIRRSAVSGIVLLFVDMAVIMLAQRYVSSSLVAIVASSIAIWITLFDVPMWRRNFRRPFTLGGLLLGVAGVAMLYMEQFDGENTLLVVPMVVLNELNGKKLSEDKHEAFKAREAYRNIDNYRAYEWLSIGVESYPELLSGDLDKECNDNKILSVALRYKTKNPIILTDDINLGNIADGYKIKTMTLKSYRAMREHTKLTTKVNGKKNRKKNVDKCQTIKKMSRKVSN